MKFSLLALIALFSLSARAGQIERVKYDPRRDRVQVLFLENCHRYRYEVDYSRACARSYPAQINVRIHATLLIERECERIFKRSLSLDAKKLDCGGPTWVHIHEDDGSVTSLLLDRSRPE